jgi:transcription antitermination factor NusG
MGEMTVFAGARSQDSRTAFAVAGGALWGQSGLPWFALQIRQTSRKACERLLEYQDATFFSPCMSVERKWSDRVKTLEIPLFPGYLFCRFDPSYRQPIVTIPGVLGIVSAGRSLLEVDASELRGIQVAVNTRRPISPVDYLVAGQRVQITSGPLRGLDGTLEQIRSRSRLLLSVTMLNRSVAVELDEADIISSCRVP